MEPVGGKYLLDVVTLTTTSGNRFQVEKSILAAVPSLPNRTVFLDRVDVALSPEHMTRPPPEAPSCAPPCAPPITPPSPGPGAPGWDREVVCIQPSRTTTPPESTEHPPQEPQNVRAYKLISVSVACFVLECIRSHHSISWISVQQYVWKLLKENDNL